MVHAFYLSANLQQHQGEALAEPWYRLLDEEDNILHPTNGIFLLHRNPLGRSEPDLRLPIVIRRKDRSQPISG
jgi:hypothetical protein